MLLRAEDHGSPDFPPVHFPCEKRTGDHPTHPLIQIITEDWGGSAGISWSEATARVAPALGEGERLRDASCLDGTKACARRPRKRKFSVRRFSGEAEARASGARLFGPGITRHGKKNAVMS
jgi:hypothetical protein